MKKKEREGHTVEKYRLKSRIMDGDMIDRAMRRLSHEIVERNKGAKDIILVGIYRRGVSMAHRLAAEIKKVEGCTLSSVSCCVLSLAVCCMLSVTFC